VTRRARYLALGALSLAVVAGFYIRGDKRDRRASMDDGSPGAAEVTVAHRDVEHRSGGAAEAAPPSLTAASRSADEAERRRLETQFRARQMVDGVTRQLLAEAKGMEGFGVETAGSVMGPYLRGMMTGLRATNPELVRDMGESLAERTCSHAQSDIEIMMVAEMVMAAPSELGSAQTFECALQGRKQEDVPLWTMIDAWRASGRPMPPALAQIQDAATDERTKNRLSNYEQALKDRVAAGEHPAAAPPEGAGAAVQAFVKTAAK
jgi:hypothetical protein